MFNQINEFTGKLSDKISDFDFFLDVNQDEKLVMQLWNHFLMSRKVLSTVQIYQACKDLAQQYGKFILSRNLRRNFLLHLLNLVDHCLLKASKVPEIMTLVDRDQVMHDKFFWIFLKFFRDLMSQILWVPWKKSERYKPLLIIQPLMTITTFCEMLDQF